MSLRVKYPAKQRESAKLPKNIRRATIPPQSGEQIINPSLAETSNPFFCHFN
jgi:hypothetical protein